MRLSPTAYPWPWEWPDYTLASILYYNTTTLDLLLAYFVCSTLVGLYLASFIKLDSLKSELFIIGL